MKYIFVVEKTDTGYSAYAEDTAINAVTVGESIAELKKNTLEALNLLFEHQGKKPIKEANIIIRLDITQFFDYYNVINLKALAARIGMNKDLLSQYANGLKKPSKNQLQKIITGIKNLGEELYRIDIL